MAVRTRRRFLAGIAALAIPGQAYFAPRDTVEMEPDLFLKAVLAEAGLIKSGIPTQFYTDAITARL